MASCTHIFIQIRCQSQKKNVLKQESSLLRLTKGFILVQCRGLFFNLLKFIYQFCGGEMSFSHQIELECTVQR